ncbi:MAG: hypothetical protein HRT72_01530 [Flavobacteriales bacterium]|nr:hypothetical protein [Flavobacteriales bacterium]
MVKCSRAYFLWRIGTLVLISSLFFLNSALGQYNWGMVNSNYNPGVSLYNNPASITDCKNIMDLTFLGVNLYVNNNFATIRRKGVLKASRDSVAAGYKSFTDDVSYNQKP